MNWLNAVDVIVWAKENLPLEKNYVIREIKIKNLGDGFEIIYAVQQVSSIHTPLLVRRARVDSYGHIVSSSNLNVIETDKGLKVI